MKVPMITFVAKVCGSVGLFIVALLPVALINTPNACADHGVIADCGNTPIAHSLVEGGGDSYGQGSYAPPPPPPVVTLYIKNLTTNAAETAPATYALGYTDEIQLRWTSSGASSCTATAVTADTKWSTGGKIAGTDADVTEPEQGTTRTYRVSCTGGGGTTADTIAVTRSVAPPVVDLTGTTASVSNGSGAFSIKDTESLTINWNVTGFHASHTPSCSYSALPIVGSSGYGQGSYGGYSQGSYGGFGSGSGYSQGSYSGFGGGYSQGSYSSGGSYGSYSQGSYGYGQGSYSGTGGSLYGTSPSTSDFSVPQGVYSGSDATVYEPSAGNTRTFSLTCSNRGGTTTDSIIVSKMARPVVSLFVRNLTAGTNETLSNITINADDHVSLRWQATNNPSSCTASASPTDGTFSTDGAVSGTDTTVEEPPLGSYRNYSVSCINDGGTGTDSVRVTNPPSSCTLDGLVVPHGSSRTFYQATLVPAGSSCTDIDQLRTCTNGVLSGDDSYNRSGCEVGATPFTDISIQANPTIVRYGDNTTITWNGGNAESCTLNGAGLTSTEVSGSENVENVQGESVYTLTCIRNGETKTEEATVRVIAQSQET